MGDREVNPYKQGEIRLVTSFSAIRGSYQFPARLDREHWGPYGEKAYWYVTDLTRDWPLGPIPLNRISEDTLNEMEVIAWAAAVDG